jgi:hypothetical protein
MSTESKDWNGVVHSDVQTSGEQTNSIAAALRAAVEQGHPFIVPWRQSPDATHPGRQVEDDASCGSGPID